MIARLAKIISVTAAASTAAQKSDLLKPAARVVARQLQKRRGDGRWTHVKPPSDTPR